MYTFEEMKYLCTLSLIQPFLKFISLKQLIMNIEGFFFSCSYIWGALSDSFGHKRVLIIGNILLGISLPLFGLSVNFPMAIAMRLLIGLING